MNPQFCDDLGGQADVQIAAIEARSMSKSFGATRALQDVGLTMRSGEVHGLVGANGCGKSTLIKILTGIHAPDEGQLLVWGRPVTFPVRRLNDFGIGVVHQKLGLQPDFTVVESVGSGVSYAGPNPGVGWRINWRAEQERCREAATALGVDIDPTARIEELPAAQKTVVAIMRALRNLGSSRARPVLILDEPTVSMSPKEVAVLEGVLRRITAEGGAVLLVSHRLTEVLTLCTRVTVLRDGLNQGEFLASELDESTLLTKMLGRAPEEVSSAPDIVGEREVVLTASGLTGVHLQDMDFVLRRGQITGFTGLVGSGHDEIPYLVAGSVRARRGKLTSPAGALPEGVRDRMRSGVAIVPGDRAKQALWTQAPAYENISLLSLGAFFINARLSRKREQNFAQALMTDFSVSPILPTLPIDTFSGGNQQKMVVGRAIRSNPTVLVLHEPTVGVDANAKRQIYSIVRSAAEQGAAVAVCSADYEELAEYCDLIYVIADGKLIQTLHNPGLSEAGILAACNQSPIDLSAVEQPTNTPAGPIHTDEYDGSEKS